MNTIKKFNTSLFIPLLLFSISACKSGDSIDTNNGDNTHDHSKHMHGNLEVTTFGEDTAIPQIRFSIEADSMNGWNVKIDTENFHFAPEKVNADASPGEGHAHIYVDDYKIARLYGNWFHLKKLTPGEHRIRIGLNANDHSKWSHQGQAIEANQIIIQH